MKVDVFVICYNQEQYVRQTLESVLMQRVAEDVEVRIIIADDCSTDGTLAIIRELETQSPFPFIYLNNSTNLGHIANYKRSFAACTGDYVCVIEGDDYWSSPYHIEKHVRFLDEHRECAMSVNKLVFYYQDKCQYVVRDNLYNDEFCYVTVRDHILQNRIDNHSACCYRTSLLKQIPDVIMGETFDDWILGIYMSQYGFIAQLRDVTSVYRIHSNGVWSGDAIDKQNLQVLHNIEVADSIFHKRYHHDMVMAATIIKRRMTPSSQRNSIRDYIPEWILSIYHGIVPPILRRRFHQ